MSERCWWFCSLLAVLCGLLKLPKNTNGFLWPRMSGGAIRIICGLWIIIQDSLPLSSTSCVITRAAMQNLDSQIWKSRISTSTKLKLYHIIPAFYPFSCVVLSAGQLPRGLYTRFMLSVNGVCESCWESNGTIVCGMTM